MKTLLLLGIGLLLASCEKEPDAKALGAALNEVRRAEFDVVLARAKAALANAPTSAGVDYQAALRKREQAEANAISAGANATDLQSHRRLGEAEGEKLRGEMAKRTEVLERQLRGF